MDNDFTVTVFSLAKRFPAADHFFFPAGATFRPDVADGIAAPGDPVRFVPEPDNPHDPHAVRVETHNAHIGYVPRGDNTLIDDWAGWEGAVDEIVDVRGHALPRVRFWPVTKD